MKFGHLRYRNTVMPLILLLIAIHLLWSRSAPATAFSLNSKERLEKFWNRGAGLDEGRLRESCKRLVEEDRSLERRDTTHGELRSRGWRSGFRDNLRDEGRYVTTLFRDGWNNQVVELQNLIFLALMSSRSPIIPSFSPHSVHLRGDAQLLQVSDVFDLEYLSTALDNLPLIEMDELKAPINETSPSSGDFQPKGHCSTKGSGVSGFKIQGGGAGDLGLSVESGVSGEEGCVYREKPELEKLVCWSYTQVSGTPGHTWESPYGIDLDLTNLPSSVAPTEDTWLKPSLPKIAELIRPGSATTPSKPATIDPNSQVSCIDHTFYLSWKPNMFAWDELIEGSGPWNTVGRNLRFNKYWRDLGKEYLRRSFELKKGSEIPPYMAIHIRRTDIGAIGEVYMKYTPLQYLHRAWEIMEDLKKYQSIEVSQVLVATDEKDPAWLAELTKWKNVHVVDHIREKTVDRYDSWHPAILDVLMLGSARGFLGVRVSTMSMFAYRRVIDWQGGYSALMPMEHTVPEGWEWPFGKN